MIRVKINLVNFLASTSRGTFEFYNVDEDSIENVSHTFTRITFSYNNITQIHKVTIEYLVEGIPVTRDYTNNDILTLSNTSTFIKFSGNILRSTIENFNSRYLTGDYIELNQDENVTLCCYNQNDENDVINKSLANIVDFIDGHFNSAIGLKNLDLDLTGFFARQFNYVYIPLFNRYYYIDSIEFISNDFTRIHLKEDVLMSHKDLIYSQNAFVTRNQNANTPYLVDERCPLKDVLSVEYITPTPTASASTKVNITIDTSWGGGTNQCYLLNCISWNAQSLSSIQSTYPPDSVLQEYGTATHSTLNHRYFLNQSQMGALMNALVSDTSDVPAVSFVNAVIYLPFAPLTAYNTSNELVSITLTSNTYLKTTGEISTGATNVMSAPRSPLCASPYLVLADFTMPTASSWKDYEPYCYYEVFIMFVGWVKIDIKQCSGDRVLIYYILDEQTGNGTAYLWNYTKHQLIYSTNCQIGVKLDLTSSNAVELSKEKQANQLNTILGLLTSAVSIGVGIATENPVAVVGGVLSAGKTLASAVNRKNLMFEKAQTTFGSGDGGIHAPLKTYIRKTYHEELSYIDSSVYEHLQGYPYNAYTDLSDLTGSGYIEVGEIHFNPNGADIYQDEINEIVSLLQQGVII